MKRVSSATRVLLALGAVLVLSSCSEPDSRWVNAFEALPLPGTAVPAFDVPLLHGNMRASNDSLLGAPAVIALWSTTCQGSRQSLAALRELFEAYQPRGVRFLILAADESLDRLTQFVDSTRLDIPVAHSPDLRAFDFSDQAPDTDEYRVLFALPSFLVIDARGTVVARSGGMLADSVLVDALESLAADGREAN